MNDTDFFTRITREAMNELARGKTSLEDTPTNTLLLACFGILSNHLTHQLARPLWAFAGSVAVGVVSYIITQLL